MRPQLPAEPLFTARTRRPALPPRCRTVGDGAHTGPGGLLAGGRGPGRSGSAVGARPVTGGRPGAAALVPGTRGFSRARTRAREVGAARKAEANAALAARVGIALHAARRCAGGAASCAARRSWGGGDRSGPDARDGPEVDLSLRDENEIVLRDGSTTHVRSTTVPGRLTSRRDQAPGCCNYLG